MAKGARHELRSKGKGVQKTYGKGRDRTRADKPKVRPLAPSPPFTSRGLRTDARNSTLAFLREQLIEDPELEEQVLRNQLREAGLYAANVLGGAFAVTSEAVLCVDGRQPTRSLLLAFDRWELSLSVRRCAPSAASVPSAHTTCQLGPAAHSPTNSTVRPRCTSQSGKKFVFSLCSFSR